MGRRGPIPQPTRLKVLRGNPGRRRLSKGEPKPSDALPRCPRDLQPAARAVWKQLIPELAEMGILTHVDGRTLERYCVLWVRWQRAETFICKNGDVFAIKDDTGRVKYLQCFPQVAIANQLAQQLHRIEQDFGMTPASRSRVRVESAGDEDDFDQFLRARRA